MASIGFGDGFFYVFHKFGMGYCYFVFHSRTNVHADLGMCGDEAYYAYAVSGYAMEDSEP